MIIFHDRPAEIVHTEFGAPIHQGCCTGYEIIGDSVLVIPENPDAAITGVDGSTDQVTIVVDAGADDGGSDGGDGGVSDAAGATD